MTYWFKPNQHWNVVSEAVYRTLSRWYGPEHLSFSEEKK